MANTFKFAWAGSWRVPKTVVLPDGTIETVKYMRDGICLFASGKSATYDRVSDNEAEFSVIETFDQAQQAAKTYLAK